MRATPFLRLVCFVLFMGAAAGTASEDSAAACAKRYADLWSAHEPVTLESLSADLKKLGDAHRAVSEEIAALKGRTASGEPVAVKTLTQMQIQYLRKQLGMPYLNDAEMVGTQARRGPFVGVYVNQLVTLQKVLEAEAARRKGAIMLTRAGLQANPFDVDTLAMLVKNMRTPPSITDKAALQSLLDAGRTYRTSTEPHTALPGYSEEIKNAWRTGIRKKCCLYGSCANCPTTYGRYALINADRAGAVAGDPLSSLPEGEPGDLVLFNKALISAEMRAEIGVVSP